MSPPVFSPDTLEFLHLLAAHDVQYLIVGDEAVIYHGYARLTGDIDIYYNPSADNAEKLHRALLEFWDGAIPGGLSREELERAGLIVQFGRQPNRIDIINAINGVTFDESWNGRETTGIEYGGKIININYIGLKELIKNKSAVGRHKDIDDLRYLEKKLHESEK